MANLIKANVGSLGVKLNRVVPGTMEMGRTGMSLMSGMFTIINVRERIDADAVATVSRHQAPAGTHAIEATAANSVKI